MNFRPIPIKSSDERFGCCDLCEHRQTDECDECNEADLFELDEQAHAELLEAA